MNERRNEPMTAEQCREAALNATVGWQARHLDAELDALLDEQGEQ